MRIVIDMQGLQTPFSKNRGVGRYTREMVKAFLTVASDKCEVFLVLNGSFEDSFKEISSEFSQFLPAERIKCWQQYLTPVSGISNNLWNKNSAELLREWYISQLNPDIIWSTNLQEGWFDDAVTSVKKFNNEPLYCSTLHDVIPLIFPEKYLSDDVNKIGDWYWEKIDYAKKSDIILTVSDFSKKKICELLKISPDKVFVAENSCDLSVFNTRATKNSEEAGSKAFSPQSYILYAGGVDEHKNVLRLILAYSLLNKKIKDKYSLVFAGKEAKVSAPRFFRYATSIGISLDRLVFTGFVTDVDLADLYRNAALFVFPSYSEGFGIPPLEAMACGCPVIAANSASLPEVIGLPEALFDPYNENEIALKIEAGLLDKNYRKRLIDNGLTRADFFSWKTSAKKILDIFEDKIANRPIMQKLDIANYSLQNKLRFFQFVAALPEPPKEKLLLLSKSVSDSYLPRLNFLNLYVDISCLIHFDHATGIQRVTRAIMSELQNVNLSEVRISAVFSYAGDKNFYKSERYGNKYSVPKKERLKQNIVDFNDGDILLFLDMHMNNVISKKTEISKLRNRGVSVYSVVYDLLPISNPNYFNDELRGEFTEWLNAVTAMDGVICISKDVSDRFRSWININLVTVSKTFSIKYFHLGADIKNSVPSKGLPDSSSDLLHLFDNNKTFLMVGTVEPRKGHSFVLDAFDLLWKDGVDVILVIVGHYGWWWRDTTTATRVKKHKQFGKRLFWLEDASDEYLEAVYNVSTCLIAASEGEGFGLPLIEAAQHKLPIIARDIPIFHEVGGDFVSYFNGEKPLNLYITIKNWLDQETKGAIVESKDMPWLSWSESAQQLLENLLPKMNKISKEKRNNKMIGEDQTGGDKKNLYMKNVMMKVRLFVIKSKFRQPLRKIYYALGLNKINI